MNIKDIKGRELIDSRGNPTVEVEVVLDNGVRALAMVPSGASTGSREALELRDGDKSRFHGKGVLKAVENVNTIIRDKVIGMDAYDQRKIDETLITLDGTPDKSKLGANAILGVSLAVCKASALSLNKPLYEYLNGSDKYILPTPMMNVINGGCHADSSMDFQEYMIVPVGAKNFREAIRMGSEVFHTLKSILGSEGHVTSVGDEGGFAPKLSSNEEPFKYIVRAISESGYKPGEDICIAIDVAASEFYNKETKLYELNKSGEGKKSVEEMINWYEELISKYPIISIEDGLSEGDNEGWKLLTNRLGSKVQLVGDDLFVTNPRIFSKGIELGIANAILIKLNQVGTVTETMDTIKMAKENGYRFIVSHRSGETEDVSIAHFAVASSSMQIKTGSMSRTDRICKYNELMRIEDRLGDSVTYAGWMPYR